MLSISESRNRLWDIAQRRLHEDKFTALWLFYVEDLPVADIANVLGRTRIAVKTMLFRARRQLMPELLGDVDELTWLIPPNAVAGRVVLASGSGGS